MRRREFTCLFCSAAVSWPLAARAQQSPLPVVGFLNGASPVPFAFFVAAFRGGLQEMAIKALVAWCAFCAVSERPMSINQSTADYFAIGDAELSYEDKLERYRELADRYFQQEEFEAFCAEALPRLDEVVVEYVESAEFDELSVRTITTEVLEPENHEALIERSRSNVAMWAADQRAAATS